MWSEFVSSNDHMLVYLIHAASKSQALGKIHRSAKFRFGGAPVFRAWPSICLLQILMYTCWRDLAKHVDVCCVRKWREWTLYTCLENLANYLSTACTNKHWKNIVNLAMLLLCMGNTMDKMCMLDYCIYWGSIVLLLSAFCLQQPLPSLMPSF